MTAFTDNEIDFLRGQPLGRLATVDGRNRPHVVPTTFSLDAGAGAIEIGAKDLDSRGQRRSYRTHIESNPFVCFVVDDLGVNDEWEPRGVLVRGTAEIHEAGGERLQSGFGPIWVKISPTRVSSWGIDTDAYAPTSSRDIS